MSLPDTVKEMIDELVPCMSAPDFNQIFKQNTADLSDSERFLLKMELSRLTSECKRPIDLREKNMGECELFEYQGVSHFLPVEGQRYFEHEVEMQHGVYNFAAYEKILRHFKVRPQTNFDSKTQKTEVEETFALPIIFGKRITRSEERMHYVTDLTIATNLKPVKAKTKDVSPTGLKIKLKLNTILPNDTVVVVHFTDLDKKYKRDFSFKVAYQVRWQKEEDGEIQAGLQLFEPETVGDFVEFIQKFVRGYRRKYRLDACNTLDAARNKLFEQFYFYGAKSLPLLLSVEGTQVELKYAGVQKSNKGICEYWQDEQRISQLAGVITAERIRTALESIGHVKTLYVFCFTHMQNQREHHFSATLDELAATKLTDLYFNFGSNKPSWRVYKIQLEELDLERAWSPVAIPDEAGREIIKRNKPLSATLTKHLSNLNYYALLIDVTNHQARLNYYRQRTDMKRINEINQFHVLRQKTETLQFVEFKFLGMRSEPRYIYRAVVEADTGKQFFSGCTKNISANGLQVEFEEQFNAELGNTVYLDFPELQLTTSEHSLKRVPYQFIGTNTERNICNFKAKSGKHQGRKYFSELSRRKALINQGGDKRIIGLESALHNLFAYSTSQSCAFMSKPAEEHFECVLANAPVATRLNALVEKFRRQETKQLEAALIQQFSQYTLTEDQHDFAELLVSYNEGKVRVVAWLTNLGNDKARKTMINECLKSGVCWVLRVDVDKSYPPDYRHVSLEMSYLSMYQPAAKQKLEKMISQVCSTLTLTDITTEAFIRFNYSRDKISEIIDQQNALVFDVFD
ncbi:PilZ domain-containing protein [Algibacillus agarilyticus]|uniref:PilZ domain-containing protein n=1 Tax=Algibacillus agarilyticus TaxID=2234133 RepID=UPI000DD0C7C2|nr:PilZ domain-containing protein [Algibacillus agarilyticus]